MICQRHKRAWKINLILWLVPLAGLGSVFLLIRDPRENGYGPGGVQSTFYAARQSARLIALSAVCAGYGGAMIAAVATGRARGFFIGTSTVLLAGIVAMWIRSHAWTDHLNMILGPESDFPKRAYLVSDSGGIVVGFDRDDSKQPMLITLAIGSGESTDHYPVLEYNKPKTAKVLGRSGFAVLYKPDLDLTTSFEMEGKFIAMPYWFPAIISSILPALWMRETATKRLRRRRGLCAFCGYDLRHSPVTCTECGRPAWVLDRNR